MRFHVLDRGLSGRLLQERRDRRARGVEREVVPVALAADTAHAGKPRRASGAIIPEQDGKSASDTHWHDR